LIKEFSERHTKYLIKNSETNIDSVNFREHEAKLEIISDNTDERIIQTIVQIGRSTRDIKTTMSVATSLAHIAEVLENNESN